ncbi:hypothetical protein CCACVL1_11145 [Corchorus capsularis]|uniref:Uncharacterized protein n=1 Tax=Corchorus capsularis TaxID=210143 RepID=A0A1R3IMQ4_COCAP|nr:hypothetical protein CCACVL1_11145 [Corchorus capsularis]
MESRQRQMAMVAMKIPARGRESF